MNSRDELQRAYLDTTFVAFALDSEIRIRVGQQNTALNDLLRKHGASTWAFITAYNPGSVLLDSSENEQRQKQLESDLRACGYVLILGAGEPGTNDSPAERSVLVLGMERGGGIRSKIRAERHHFRNREGVSRIALDSVTRTKSIEPSRPRSQPKLSSIYRASVSRHRRGCSGSHSMPTARFLSPSRYFTSELIRMRT